MHFQFRNFGPGHSAVLCRDLSGAPVRGAPVRRGMARRRNVGVVMAVWLVGGSLSVAQPCADPTPIKPVSQPNRIEWGKFPDFTLPFPVIFGGPRLGDSQGSPLRHGFSHIVDVQANEYGSVVQPRQRAVVYYGFATGLGQPWETIESPWANDMNAYRAKWERFLTEVSGGQRNAAGQYVLPIDRLTLDIERFLETDVRILRLKADSRVPAQYRQLSDADLWRPTKKRCETSTPKACATSDSGPI